MNLKFTPFRVLRAAALSVAWLLPIAGFCAADDVATLNESGVRERLEHWIAPYMAEKDFSGVILIAQGNRLIAQQAYGKADFAHNRPNTPGTRFRIASLSKTFTAAAIERLIAEGKISLQDTLSHFISGMPTAIRLRSACCFCTLQA